MITDNHGDYVKARDLIDERITILDGDFREGKFGPEVVYEIRRADSSRAGVSLSRREFRERGLQRIWAALRDRPEGVAATLIMLEGARDGTEAEKVYLWDPFEVGRQPSAERLAWERSQSQGGLADELRARRQLAMVPDDDPGPTDDDAQDARWAYGD